MKIMFIDTPQSAEGVDWATVHDNIRNELGHFEHRFVEFPESLVVRLEINRTQSQILGHALGPDGTPVVEITYNASAPHLAEYKYIGGSAARQVEVQEKNDG